MDIKDKLDLEQIGTPVDATKYCSMIGALMYLTSSRPDIIHATCVCARYQAQPTEKHLKEVKRIFRYLWGTVSMCLWYTKDSNFELTGFSDVDYAGCKDTFKSTFGGAQFHGEKLVSWSSKKQDYTSLSTAESEYVSLSACSIAISCNPVQHSRTKHIAFRYHFIKEHVEKVIEFGDSYKAPPQETSKGPASESSTKKKERTVVITTEDMQKRRNDVKARTTLLLALPDEHQLRFSKYETAKELWKAILKTFGGNEATKKTKKNQLKLQYGNFKAEGSKTLEQTFNRLQAIVSYLEFMDVEIEQDDLNQKFLTTLAPEWLMYTIVWRNKDDLDTMSLDDVYNHLKVYEPKVQKKSESNSQNMAFISSSNTSSRKGEVYTASVPTASIQVSTASTEIDEDDIKEMDIKWNMALVSMRADRFWKKTGKKITIQGSDVAGFDKSKVECFNCHKMGHFARECRAPRSQDRENYALVADDEVLTEFSLMAKLSSSLENKVEARLVEFKEHEIKFCERIRGLERDVEIRDNKIEYLTNELESQRSDKNKKGLGYNAIPPPSQVYSPPKKDFSWTCLPEFVDDTITDYSRPIPSIDASKCNTSDLQSSNFSVSEHEESSGSIMSKPMIKFVKEVDCPRETREKLLRPQLVGFGDLNKILNGVSVTFKKYQYIDTQGRLNGCSQHMTSNIFYLSDYEPYDGGYISFGQGGGKITGKGIIITDFKLKDDTNVLLRTPRQHNMYSIDLNNIVPHKNLTYLVAKASVDESICHLNFKTMNKLVRNNLVKCLPSKCFENDHTCVACLKRKHHKASCKTKLVNSVSKPLHTLHMDLFGPTSVSNLNHKWYFLVVTDDFSRFTWTFFLRTKDETSSILRNLITEIENLKDLKVKIIRCDNRGEFKNKEMNEFCTKKEIRREFSNARTPQQNRVAERRNRTLIEAARLCWLMLSFLSPFGLKQIPAIGFLRPFGCHVMILNTLDHLGKFDAKGDEDYFVSGISNPTATLKVPSTDQVESAVSLTLESETPTVSSPVPTVCLDNSPESLSGPRLITKGDFSQKETLSLGNALTLSNRFEDTFRMEADLINKETSIPISPTLTFRIHKDHPKSQIIGPVDTPVETRHKSKEMEEQRVRPIGTKWVLKNKKDERGIVIRNKARLVAQGGYVMQPPGFQDPEFPDRVYKVEKAMYGLHQAPRAWYGTLSKDFKALMHNKFQMSAMGELTFFLGLQVLQKKDGIFLSQDKYVGNILKKFGYSDVRSANTPMDKENPWGKDGPGKDVELHLYRSMIGSLMYFTASRPDIMFAVYACARHQVTPEECYLYAVKRIFRYLKGSEQRIKKQRFLLQLMGEGSTNPTEPHHTPSPHEHHSPQHDSPPPSHPTTTSEPISQALTEPLTHRQYTRRAKRIAQSKALSPAAYEPASLSRDDIQGEPMVPRFLWGRWMEVVGSMWSDGERQESGGDGIVGSGGKSWCGQWLFKRGGRRQGV
nr:hypothetical protein [Tanacetum cinerariifolium]